LPEPGGKESLIVYLFGGSAPDQMTPSPRWHGAVDGSNEMYQ
jgi:hypothetical protein